MSSTMSRMTNGKAIPIASSSQIAAGSAVKLEVEQPIDAAEELIVTTDVVMQRRTIYRDVIRIGIPARPKV